MIIAKELVDFIQALIDQHEKPDMPAMADYNKGACDALCIVRDYVKAIDSLDIYLAEDIYEYFKKVVESSKELQGEKE